MIHGQTCNLSLILCSHSSHNLFSPDTDELLGSISHAHTHTPRDTYARSWDYNCTCMALLLQRPIYMGIHMYTHVLLHTLNPSHTHTGTQARARPYIQTHTQTHTHTQYLLALRVHYSHRESWHLYCSSSLSVVIDQNIQEVYVQSRPLL